MLLEILKDCRYSVNFKPVDFKKGQVLEVEQRAGGYMLEDGVACLPQEKSPQEVKEQTKEDQKVVDALVKKIEKQASKAFGAFEKLKLKEKPTKKQVESCLQNIQDVLALTADDLVSKTETALKIAEFSLVAIQELKEKLSEFENK